MPRDSNSNSLKNVLITGGTGFIGSNLAHALLREGCSVRIFRRPHSKLHAIGNANIEHFIGDILDPVSVKQAMQGCDTVFHTAAFISYRKKEREAMYKVNITGTRNVVNACLELGVRKLVHTSSIAAIGFSRDGPHADEFNAFNWQQYDIGYRISKHLAEKEIERGVKLGLPAVMVNPAVVIGPRDIHFHGGQLIRDVYKKRVFFFIAGGMNIVYIDDVVRGHIEAARLGRIGERYILCGENLTFEETLTRIAEIVGGWAPRFQLPAKVVQWLSSAVETTSDMLHIKPWITKELFAGIGINNYYTSEKAQRELGYSITPFNEAVEKTFLWYKSAGLL